MYKLFNYVIYSTGATRYVLALLFWVFSTWNASGQKTKPGITNVSAIAAVEAKISVAIGSVEPRLIAWRRDIHQNPELGDQEKRTSQLVAEHLRKLGIEVQTGIGGTGVVGILTGGKPGKLVALRADMDALAVKEPEGLPFASKVTAQQNGTTVPLMHACGHDTHTAMLMAAAEVLATIKEDLPGSVMFIFQPAEEGSSVVEPGTGESWGAKRMLEDGIFRKAKPDAIFALHVHPGKSGQIDYKSGPATASSDVLNIVVSGQQGHGGMPWNTIDPIVASAYVIAGLQSVVSRSADLTRSPAVVSVGMIHGGASQNVIPDTVKMVGTIRSYDPAARKQLHTDIKQAAEHIAEGTYAKAQVNILPMYDVTENNDALATQMLPVLKRATKAGVVPGTLQGASEDFSFFAKEVPGLYIFLGITPDNEDPAKAAPNHNPKFFVDEKALPVGTRAMAFMAANFLMSNVNGQK